MLYQPSTTATVTTITRYIVSDIKKKSRSFGIGIFTIFLVVMFIVTLKSLIDVSHIAILKGAQDQAGAIDLTLKSSYPTVVFDADRNFYSYDSINASYTFIAD